MNLRNKQFFRRFIAVNMTVASAFPANLPPHASLYKWNHLAAVWARSGKQTLHGRHLNLREIGADLKLARFNQFSILNSRRLIFFFIFFVLLNKKRLYDSFLEEIRIKRA